MAPDSSAKKRKAAPPPSAASTKKVRKSPAKPATTKKTAAAPAPTPAVAAKKNRKTAADFMSNDDESDEGGWEKLNAKENRKKSAKSKQKPAKKEEKKEEEPTEEDEVKFEEEVHEESSEDEDDADQTATLLKGFESSDEEENFQDVSVDGKAIAKSAIPDEKKTKKKLKAAKKAQQEKSEPGVVYLGRVPHGFYEHEMRAYFSQFGNVTRLRLSRNKTTGKSKHYAFIEFDDSDVAQIVADTMNNYLLFGHILKCKVVPRDNPEYIEKLFKGANKRYKPRPMPKLAKAEFEKKRPEEKWEKIVKKENSKRKNISKRLKEKGIDYEFEAPEAKKAKTEEKKEEDEPKAIDEKPAATTEDSAMEDSITVASEVPKEEKKAAPAKKSKAKKAKKAKA